VSKIANPTIILSKEFYMVSMCIPNFSDYTLIVVIVSKNFNVSQYFGVHFSLLNISSTIFFFFSFQAKNNRALLRKETFKRSRRLSKMTKLKKKMKNKKNNFSNHSLKTVHLGSSLITLNVVCNYNGKYANDIKRLKIINLFVRSNRER
jgi:hypothetical protein